MLKLATFILVLQLLLGNCTEISKCTILVLKLGLKINEAYVGKL